MSDRGYTPASVTPPPGAAAPVAWPPSGPSDRRPVVLGALVVALLVLAVFWHKIDRQYPVLAGGTMVDNDSDGLHLVHRASVNLPWGTLAVGVTTPRRTLPHNTAEFTAGGDVRPPDGGRFIGVHWSGELGSVPTILGFVPQTDPPTTVTLVADGHSYSLAPDSGTSYCGANDCIGQGTDNDSWVAVDGDASQLHLRVGFDGVTQDVDLGSGHVDRGRAAGLADARGEMVTCGSPRWTAQFVGHKQKCSATIERSPWIAGLGWAPSGRLWFAAAVDVEEPYSVTYTAAGRKRTFDTGTQTPTLAFSFPGGHQQVRQVANATNGSLQDPAADAVYYGTKVAYSAPARAIGNHLVVRATWGLDPRSGPFAAATRLVTATWTVRS